jgi:hypothetical protein
MSDLSRIRELSDMGELYQYRELFPTLEDAKNAAHSAWALQHIADNPGEERGVQCAHCGALFTTRAATGDHILHCSENPLVIRMQMLEALLEEHGISDPGEEYE